MASFGSGFSFGSTTTPAATSTAASGGINFGFSSNTVQSSTSSGFQLGAQATPQNSAAPTNFGGLNFGTNSTTASNPLLAGGSNNAALANPLLGGTTTSSSSGFSFGAAKPSSAVAPQPASTAAVSGFSFGAGVAPPASTASGALGFGLVSQTATPASTAAPTACLGGFSFGQQAAAPAASTAAVAASSAITPFSFGGLGGAAATSCAPAVATTSTGLGGGPAVGLGGAQPPATAAGEAAGSAKVEGGKPSKETPLPQEIFATIAAFESFKSVEKAASEANLRQSGAAFHKLGEDCKKLHLHVTQLSTAHAALQQRVNALKDRIVKDSEDIEMARRTQNTPAHLQGDNTAPDLYFNRAIHSFEGHMLACRERIEEVEKCLAVGGHTLDSEAALRELVRRQHEALQVAASRVYTLHAALLRLSEHLPCPDQLKPRPLFRPGAGDLSALDDVTRSAVPKESAVVRSCFELPGGASRLGAFQVNMAKARALSLNPAPPPTQPLQQPLFGGSSNFNAGSSNFGNPVGGAFGTANTSNFAYPTSAFGGTGATGFGTGSPSTFGTTSNFNPGTNFLGTGGGGNNNNSSFSFNSPSNNNNNSQAGSLFSSTFGQSNKLFKT